MRDLPKNIFGLPPEQQTIRAKCFHPTGTFVEFKKEEIEQSIPERFEKIVRMYPDRLAVKTRNYTLTYDALNKMANRMARAILAQRGQGEEPIALLLEHDAPLIVAILGVLKAGKIYVPMDSTYPHARTHYMLEDSQATLIVTNSKNLSLAKEFPQNALQPLSIDELDTRLSTENPGLSISPETPTHIIYTSGSTGRPKGVVHNHRNVLYLIRNYTNSLHICAEDRLTLLYSGSVIGAVKDMFGALLNGAALFPFNLKEEGVGNLANWLNQEEITIYHSVTTIFRHFLGTLTEEEKFPGLRLNTIGGEALSKREVELYKKYFSQECILHSVLGSTELSSACQYFLDKETQIIGNTVPAGYPVEDVEVLLLDNASKAAGVDGTGEIAFKSPYLALGYWRKPDLTRAVFLSDPAGGGARIYRTGDLGRMRVDGCLERLGRKDFQVKVRGHRIEVGEIETLLFSLGTIKEAVVVAGEDRPDEKRLVAYIVPVGKPPPTVSRLRRALAERLPDYMIPSAFVMLDTLPLTPNGKLDRRALAVLGPIRPELDTPFVAPRTSVEETLAEIWAEVLYLDQVGIYDNFVDLGGHSLLAIQVISRVIKTFQVELPLRSLFEAPTVAEMAVVITENQAKQLGEKDLTLILTDLEALSEEDAQRLLASERKPTNTTD